MAKLILLGLQNFHQMILTDMAPLSSYGTTTVFKLIFLAGSFCRLLAVREQTRDGIGTGFKATFPGFQRLSNLSHKEIYLVFRA